MNNKTYQIITEALEPYKAHLSQDVDFIKIMSYYVGREIETGNVITSEELKEIINWVSSKLDKVVLYNN